MNALDNPECKSGYYHCVVADCYGKVTGKKFAITNQVYSTNVDLNDNTWHFYQYVQTLFNYDPATPMEGIDASGPIVGCEFNDVVSSFSAVPAGCADQVQMLLGEKKGYF